jgi:tartrate dehydrogenase/decarboxylase/D-malate dehydrogenase
MLEYLGLSDEAKRIHRAIEATTRQGVLTPDIGGTARTAEVTSVLIDHLGG